MSQSAQVRHPLTQQDFSAIYSRVPRLTAEVIVKNSDGEIFLTKRAIEPCKGQWHLPGGTVRLGESLVEAARRVAKTEIGLAIRNPRLNGYIEYPSHHASGYGWPVGIAFEVTDYSGTPKINGEASDGRWFKSLPANMHAHQDTYLVRAGYLTPRA